MIMFIIPPSFLILSSLSLFITSTPNDKGVISIKLNPEIKLSVLFKILAAIKVAPTATASSGLIESFILLFLNIFLNNLFTMGSLDAPPTSTTSEISFSLILASFKASFKVSSNLLIKSFDKIQKLFCQIDSKISRLL